MNLLKTIDNYVSGNKAKLYNQIHKFSPDNLENRFKSALFADKLCGSGSKHTMNAVFNIVKQRV